MEQNQIACGNQLPPLSANYPWLVSQDLDGTGGQTFYTIHDQLCRYRCRIPKLLGRRIRGYFHGWVILSNNNMWSVWNPMTSKIINLPPLILNNSESIGQCCLSSPPNDPISVLLLTITGKPTFVFCRLRFKRKKLRWKRMSYNTQLKGIIGRYDGFLQCPTSYNGKVYAMCNDGDFVIKVDIIVEDGEVLIKLLLYGRLPSRSHTCFPASIFLLKGSGTELFYIALAFNEASRKTLGNVYLFKWAMTGMRWEEMVDMKNAIFFVDIARDCSVYYSHAISPEFGGYIHICDEMGKTMYSYNVENKTIFLSSMDYPTSHVSLWECRLEGDREDAELTLDSEKEDAKDDKIAIRSVMDDEVELNGSQLLDLPFHLLEKIMDHCIGVEYMCFRATCKSCLLAAPLIQWSNKTSLRRLHNHSVVSPWLMVVGKNQDITFTDPMFGDKYFVKRPQVSIHKERIRCSRFGWILFYSDYSILVFLNPFTGVFRKLPHCRCYLDSVCFSTPPTSPGCMVVGFSDGGSRSCVCIHFVAREQAWVMIRLNFVGGAPNRFCFPTFCGRDLYVLCDKGEVYVFKNLFKLEGYYYKKVVGAKDSEGEYFLVKRDQQFLLVIVGRLGEFVRVFEPNYYTKKWEKIKCLGRFLIYICSSTCLCIETKSPEMRNKIFFPQLDSKDGRIVFYSLETCRYHRFNGKHIEDVDWVGTKHVFPRRLHTKRIEEIPHAWIEPTWS